jgi:threonine aldolase
MSTGETLIDLRSDTVTRPDDEMRRAMAEAEVGDDVLREDPTVRRLEEMAAELTGFEASLFVPSGTMGNQIALHLHAQPGTEVICEATSHIFNYEMGAMAALSGLLPRPVAAERGLLLPEQIEAAIVPEVAYRARTGMIAVENTANMAGGTVYSVPAQEEIISVARRRSLPIHLDGARIFNAAVALGVEVAELGQGFDSSMFCLSKGLGAPVGSMLCGSRAFVEEARRVRKMFGGGMRQSGVLAAAGLVALRRGPSLLERDHEHAVLLAEVLEAQPGLRIVSSPVETNIVVTEAFEEFARGSAETPPAERLVARLRESAILAAAIDPRRVRLVTHRDVDRSSLDRAIERIGSW